MQWHIDLGYNNIWNELGSGNVVGPVSEERPLTKYWNDLVHHPLFPACHLNRPSICMAGPRVQRGGGCHDLWGGQTPVGQTAQKLATSSILVQLIRHGPVFQFLDLPINKLLCGCPEAFWWLTALTYSKIHRSSSTMGFAGVPCNHMTLNLCICGQKACELWESC